MLRQTGIKTLAFFDRFKITAQDTLTQPIQATGIPQGLSGGGWITWPTIGK